MRCKDCMHYVICQEFGIDEYPPTRCDTFKDKSKFIELPVILNYIGNFFDECPCNISPCDEWLPMFCEEKYNDCCEIGATNCWERFFEFLPKAEEKLKELNDGN